MNSELQRPLTKTFFFLRDDDLLQEELKKGLDSDMKLVYRVDDGSGDERLARLRQALKLGELDLGGYFVRSTSTRRYWSIFQGRENC